MVTFDQRNNLQREIKSLSERIRSLEEERQQWIEDALDLGIDDTMIDRWCGFSG